jgi:hypothetical protein
MKKKENPMNELKNSKPCCEEINTGPSYTYSGCGKPVSRKMPKLLFCLVVLLAVVGIVAYRTMSAGGNSSNDNIVLGYHVSNYAVDFAFGQPALETTTSTGHEIQAEQNLGEYVESLDELNIVAVENEAVLVFIPSSGNVLVDDTTKAAVFETQKELSRGNTTIGLYTLWCDSQEYSEIRQRVNTPAIIIAYKDKGTITMPGRNVTESKLLQAYLNAATKICCEYYSSNCCGN